MVGTMETGSGTLPELRTPLPGGMGEDFVVPEPDVYELVIAEVQETRQAMFAGQVKDGKFQVRLKVQVVGGEFDGAWWRQWVGYSLHEKAFLREILMAIRNNRPLEEGQSVDLLKYIDKPFRGVVQVDDVPAREDPSRILRFAKVTSAMPLRRAEAAAPAPAAARPAAPGAFDNDPDDPFEGF